MNSRKDREAISESLFFRSLRRLIFWARGGNSRRIERVRYYYWKLQLQQLGEGTRIYGRIHIRHPECVTIGEGCTLNHGVSIFARQDGHVQIGNGVRISPRVTIVTGGLDFEETLTPYKHSTDSVTVQDGVWLAAGALLLPGVTIGKHSVVAAGAVVTGSVPPSTLVGGVPARTIRQIACPEGSRRGEP